jgi:type II secretion system protein G
MAPHNGVVVHETRMLASAVRVRGGRAWVAKFSRETIEAIEYASQQLGVGVAAVVPSLDVIARGLAAVYDSIVPWPPARPVAAIRWAGGAIQAAVDIAQPLLIPEQAHLTPVPALAVLGGRATAFADAYGVAVSHVPFGETGALTPELSDSTRARIGDRSAATVPRCRVSTVRRAFTLIELIVVIAIIATLAAVVAPSVFRNVGDAKVGAAKSQIEVFALALNAYRLDNDNFPTTDQGLDALRTTPTVGDPPRNWRGPYLSRSISIPWAATANPAATARTRISRRGAVRSNRDYLGVRVPRRPR